MEFIKIQGAFIAKNQIVYVKKYTIKKAIICVCLLITERDGGRTWNKKLEFEYESVELRDKAFYNITKQL